MRIIAGAWRGRVLNAPPGDHTRPTAERVRQAMFDMLLHAPWGGREVLEGARVLDGFAGTGALGLEALSRGAARTTFFENDPAALATLRANVAACKAGDRARVVAGSVLRPGRCVGVDAACGLIFLDPPYGQGLVQRSLNVLRAEGWLAPGALIIAETSRLEPGVESGLEQVVEGGILLAYREHGAARINVWRE